VSDTAPQIDAALVRHLVAAQMPDWAGQTVTPLPPTGAEHRTFRLGDALCVRLPLTDAAARGQDREARVLAALAPHLPAPAAEIVATGKPGPDFPRGWKVRRWIAGQPAGTGASVRLATDLASFLRALHAVPVANGLGPEGPGGALADFEDTLCDGLDQIEAPARDAARDLWNLALRSDWQHAPLWVHGDLLPRRILVDDGGGLAGVLGFDHAGLGDPARDLAIASLLFRGESRAAFHLALPFDPDTWTRARGWALFHALAAGAAAPGLVAAVLDDAATTRGR